MINKKYNGPKREFIEYWNIYGDSNRENKPSEKYLLELLNRGAHFGTHFEYVEKQNHGEPDIRGDNGYELDFKLFLSTSDGKSRKDFIKNHRNDYFDYYDLAEVIKDKTVEELEYVEKMSVPNDKYNAEQISIVKHFLKKCRTNKNLLFFAPRYFYSDTISEVLDYFNDVVRGAMEYREKQVEKDTYFGWLQIFEDVDVLYEWDKQGILMEPKHIYFVLAKYNPLRDRLEIMDSTQLSKSKYFLRHHTVQFDYFHCTFEEIYKRKAYKKGGKAYTNK
jgi:hypothetical protein